MVIIVAYVLGEHAGYMYPTYEKIIDAWTPDMWPQEQVVAVDTTQLPGVAVAVWSDQPDAQTQEEVLLHVSEIFFAVMQKLMGDVFITKEALTAFLATILK